MPLYIYTNEETGEVKEVLQSMNEEHTYEENGVKWKRIWTIPQGSIDANIDPFSLTQFKEKTNKKDSVGSLIDRAKELSEKRAAKSGGKDPLKQKWFKDYSKKRHGKRHPADRD